MTAISPRPAVHRGKKPNHEEPLGADAFDLLFGTFHESAFRLQTLPAYGVQTEDAEFEAWQRGEAAPSRDNHPWFLNMKASIEAGKIWEVIHVVPDPITPYLEYVFAWWHTVGLALKEKIGIIKKENASELLAIVNHDFWLFGGDTDHPIVVKMYYSPDGEWQGQTMITNPTVVRTYVAARDLARSLATPFVAPGKLGLASATEANVAKGVQL